MVPERGIVRMDTNDGWYVLAVRRSQSPKAFFDVSFGNSQSASYEAAVTFNLKLRPYRTKAKNYQSVRATKANPELPVGISLSVLDRANLGNKGFTTVHNFKVSLFNGKTATVYIGTAKTWKANYEAALSKAIEIRERKRASIMKLNTGPVTELDH